MSTTSNSRNLSLKRTVMRRTLPFPKNFNKGLPNNHKNPINLISCNLFPITTKNQYCLIQQKQYQSKQYKQYVKQKAMEIDFLLLHNVIHCEYNKQWK